MDNIVTLVGTSLFQNHPHLKELAKGNDFKVLKQNAFNAAKEFLNDQECCAELSSILPLKGSKRVHLIATKSAESIFCGYFIKKILNHHVVKVFFDPGRSVNLSFDRYENYERGLDELLDRIFELLQEVGSKDLVFNITSGYRGIIPYISAVAQVFGCRILYDFLGKENKPIVIEPLPIEFDRSILYILYPYLKFYGKVKIPAQIKKQLKDMGLVENGRLTPLGRIALFAIESHVYDRSILGHEMELLLYEYFVDKKDRARKLLEFEYDIVKRSYKEEGFRSDIDIYLANDKEYIWIEVKPINKLEKNSLDHIVNQFKNHQKKDVKLHKRTLKRYVVVLYGYKLPFELYEDNIKNFKNDMKRKFGIETELYFLEIPLKKSDNKYLQKNNLHKIASSCKIEDLKKVY